MPTGLGLRPVAKAPDEPPNPTGYAPPLDSTGVESRPPLRPTGVFLAVVRRRDRHRRAPGGANVDRLQAVAPHPPGQVAHEGARRVANRGRAHRALQHGGDEGAEELVRDGPQLLFALLRFLCRPGRWSTRLKLQRPPEGSAQVNGNVAKIDLAARGVDGVLVHFNAPSWAVRAVMSSTTLPVSPKTGSTSPSLTVHLCLHTALLREIGNAPTDHRPSRRTLQSARDLNEDRHRGASERHQTRGQNERELKPAWPDATRSVGRTGQLPVRPTVQRVPQQNNSATRTDRLARRFAQRPSERLRPAVARDAAARPHPRGAPTLLRSENVVQMPKRTVLFVYGVQLSPSIGPLLTSGGECDLNIRSKAATMAAASARFALSPSVSPKRPLARAPAQTSAARRPTVRSTASTVRRGYGSPRQQTITASHEIERACLCKPALPSP